MPYTPARNVHGVNKSDTRVSTAMSSLVRNVCKEMCKSNSVFALSRTYSARSPSSIHEPHIWFASYLLHSCSFVQPYASTTWVKLSIRCCTLVRRCKWCKKLIISLLSKEEVFSSSSSLRKNGDRELRSKWFNIFIFTDFYECESVLRSRSWISNLRSHLSSKSSCTSRLTW